MQTTAAPIQVEEKVLNADQFAIIHNVLVGARVGYPLGCETYRVIEATREKLDAGVPLELTHEDKDVIINFLALEAKLYKPQSLKRCTINSLIEAIRHF